MVRLISAAEAIAAQAQPGTVLLDVRSGAEIAVSGTARGALRIPTADIPPLMHRPDSADARRILAAEQVIVFCAVGARAKAVAELLVSKGVRNVSVFNAFRDWVDAGGAVEAV